MNPQLKQFYGWRPLLPDESIQDGDKFVLIYQVMAPGRALTPESGESIGHYAGHYAREWNSATIYWYPYRRTSEAPLPRRLAGSRTFATPLPLP